MILITHDLGIVAEVAQRVIVMYAGKIMEMASVDEIFNDPFHPYTHGLYESLPRIDRGKKRRKEGIKEQLKEIPGAVPSPLDFPKGCRFSPRCLRALPICREEEPSLSERKPGHHVACWLAE
jgi:peptide/nickel transport system ATP-binding protein